VVAVGETALVVNVPEAEPLVRRWRQREIGLMAHVTVLVPFMHAGLLDDGVRDDLRLLFSRHPAFEVRFLEVRRFLEVIYLAPEPAEAFALLTEAVVERWPQTPPYGGLYDQVVPHLTVGRVGRVDEAALSDDGWLPVAARASAVSLLVHGDDGQWRETEVFPLARA
jgi:2'-5' RNA ligase